MASTSLRWVAALRSGLGTRVFGAGALRAWLALLALAFSLIANGADLFGLLKEGKIKPHISNRYPLERAADAIKELSERRAMGKVVVTI